jgi:O-antigen ligase
MVGEDVSWFSQLGAKAATVPVRVEGQPSPELALPAPAPAPSPTGKLELTQPAPARRPLWEAALRMWSRRPLFGIGPTVFQHTYGPEIGQPNADSRYHTHNLFLELLTGSGLPGLFSLLGLLGLLWFHGLRRLARTRREAGPAREWWWLLLSLGGMLAFLAHGMLDMFLAFTPTYLLFWAWAGMIGGLTIEAAPGMPPSSAGPS